MWGGKMAVYLGENKVAMKGGFTGGSSATLQAKSVVPTEEIQVVTPDSGYDGLANVTVGAIKSNYVGSSVPRKSAQTYTPSTSNITISSDQYLTGTQTIAGDSNLVASNIKKGVSIFGKTGTYEGEGTGGIDTSDATATADDMADGKTAYVNGQKITGTIPSYPGAVGITATNVSSTTSSLVLTTRPQKMLLRNNNIYVTTSLSNFGDATADDVVSGKTFTSASGLKVTGTHKESSSGSSDNGYNCESYFISDVSDLSVTLTNKKNIKAYGYAVNGYSKYMFCGDKYANVAYGVSSATYSSLSLSISNGKVTGLPTLQSGSLLITAE